MLSYSVYFEIKHQKWSTLYLCWVHECV